MEIIKNYLESMFANMPNTEKVRRAKDELWQMMEDKYTELIDDGVSENEAVGTVITEFGNLDELADDLGLREAVSLEKKISVDNSTRTITLEEAKAFLSAKADGGFKIGLGVLLCIISVTGPILVDTVGLHGSLSILLMFGMIAAAIIIFITTGSSLAKWHFVEKEKCQIDMQTARYVHDAKEKYASAHALRKSIGIIFCAMCWLPAAVFSEFSVFRAIDDLAAVLLFTFVGIGVLLLISTNTINGSYKTLLSLNDKTLVSGNYTPSQKREYVSAGAQLVGELYWPVVTSVYLIWSFISFDWHITWIVWVVAGIMFGAIKNLLTKNSEV